MTLVRPTVRLIRAAAAAYEQKWAYLGAFAAVFLLSFIALDAAGLAPDPSVPAPAVTVAATDEAAAAAAAAPAAPELPTRIEIPAIKLSATIKNPDTTDIEKLDGALLTGAVRYPTSAKLGEAGNVILFGHSSYLPVVNNQAFKTFNGIQKLAAGDRITVYSSDRAYEYRVDTVSQEDATSAAIPLTVEGSKLTLSTCDSFASKSDRFVVTATLVDSHLIGA
jgi:LPXTG-site transpeptidase (sortase) family protein